MGTITSGIGLISGLNTTDIIDQLMKLEARPRDALTARITTANTRRTALTDIQTRLTGLRIFGMSVKKTATFKSANVTSSNEAALTATAATGAATGSYKFNVARLVSSQQSISKGYADSNSTAIGAGTLSFEVGGGELNTPTKLNDLNGGAGITRGSFRITDRSGNFQVLDITDAVTLNDVVAKINNSLDISVRATIDGNRLLLNDATGLTSGTIKVEDLNGGTSATELGIAGSASDGSIVGEKIQKITNETLLSTLNEGRGVRFNSDPDLDDIRITLSDGSTHDISFAGATTVGDIRMKIEQITNNDAALALNSAQDGFYLGDWSVDWGDEENPPIDTFEVEALNGSNFLTDLGLTGNSNGIGQIGGKSVMSSLNSTLISSLRGGQGLTLGTIRITDRGSTSHDIDLSGADNVDDIISEINDAFNGRIVARLNGGGTGIELEDKSGGLNAIVVSDLSGSTAAQLGIDGTYQRSHGDIIRGDSLQKAWFNESTLLKDLNFGKGVPEGKFTVRGSGGLSANITIDQTTKTIGDVIDKINDASLGVTASINANGDGLLLTDTAGGGLKLQVSEYQGGTLAKSLNILGQAETTTIDGSWEKSVAIDADDTLEDVRKKINDLGWGVSASIINDGGASPYRLSLTTTSNGRGARVAIDAGATALDIKTIAEAHDAVVFVSSESSAQPIMVTSNTNTVSGVVPGLTLQLQGVSDEAVTLNVARNVDNVIESANKFVEDFNALLDQLDEYTKFDTETNERGVLLGDPSTITVQREMYASINNVVASTGKYRMANDVGLRIGEGGRLEFDEAKFRTAYADDPDAVINLFTKSVGSLDGETRLDTLNHGNGVGRAADPAQADLRINIKDGTSFDVNLASASTMQDVIDAINDSAAGRVTASINTSGTGLRLIDNTPTESQVSNKLFSISALNGSSAVYDLGLNVRANGKFTSTDGRGTVIDSKELVDVNAGEIGGIGQIIERRINRLIDPVTGTITRAGTQIDNSNDALQRRIDSLNVLLESKRNRLLKQFTSLETTLAKLQTQQSSLSNLQTISFNNTSRR